MEKNSKIFVAGHRGMVGSAIVRKLAARGFNNIITRTHKELDLTRQADTERFFETERPEYVFLAAARVGGIHANSTYTAEFIYQNITIASNIIHASHLFGVKKLLNLGSTCIYPKFAPQPMKEEHLLTGLLEPTNEAYAIAKIAAIKLCRYYGHQYGSNFMSVMPTNLYGPNDNYNLANSHVLPAFIRKFHLAKLFMNNDMDGIAKDLGRDGTTGDPTAVLNKIGITKDKVTLWGSGSPYREFLYADDLAEACFYVMETCNAKDLGEFVNIGTGTDYQLKEIAQMVKQAVGYTGDISWDTSKPDGTPKKLSDSTRINALGWKATTELPDGIAAVYSSYQKN